MRLTWLAQTLRDDGCTVVEYPGWMTRGHDTMKPGGVVIHHTGGQRSDDRSYADFLVKGRADLPGPLSQLFLARDGRYWVLASGRANHAGRGGWRGLTGNSSVIGIEAESTGKDGWPAVQLDAYIVGVAAILRRLGRTADFVCGHKEWAQPAGRKWDPGGIDMDEFRRQVGELLVPKPAPDTLTPVEVNKLRQFIASFESVGSNPTFPQYTIPHTRDGRAANPKLHRRNT